MFKKVLVANRGEIAVRIIRSCRELGVKTVAVYSEADRSALHTVMADEAHCIGPASPLESYLSKDAIIQTAINSGAEAIHPGYGFLSENAEFARACEKEGIVFIGPSSGSIKLMGDKLTARQIVQKAGVSVVPGSKGAVSDDEAEYIAEGIGYPIMVKASAGGGGKGMRLIQSNKDLKSSIRMARSEARSAFGDDSLYIEKFIQKPRHIEIQVLGDEYGNTIHLFERECSIQRRHQKVIEEAPSAAVDDKTRLRMGEVAVKAAKAVSYKSAGTVEFIFGEDRNFYFLEMNTRIQVEHPVTEMITGVDLIKWQIRMASGERLTLEQDDLSIRGHAMECRIYAEDPERNFLPSAGKVEYAKFPGGPGIRDDTSIYSGYEVPVFYDPLLSKLITWGITREETIRRMKRALREYMILGVKTNIGFLRRVMESEEFIRGEFDTGFIETHPDLLNPPSEELNLGLAAAAFTVRNSPIREIGSPKASSMSNWKLLGRRLGVSRSPV